MNILPLDYRDLIETSLIIITVSNCTRCIELKKKLNIGSENYFVVDYMLDHPILNIPQIENMTTFPRIIYKGEFYEGGLPQAIINLL